MIAPDRTTATIASAGHLPPILAVPGQPACLVDLPVDTPLGIGRTRGRRRTVIDLPPSALLLCYTDGLVERRGEVIDVGLGRLIEAVRPTDPQGCVAAIMAGVGSRQMLDDVAVIALQRSGDGRP